MEENGEMEFPAFPYKPYSIQIDFMKALYQSLEKGGIAMLESPTGTGKTLSIICSALQWLVEKKQKKGDFIAGSNVNSNSKPEAQCDSDDEPDWVRNFVVNKESEPPQANKTKKKKFGSIKLNNKKEKEGCRTIRDMLSRDVGVEDVADKPGPGMKIMKSKSGVEEVGDEEFLVENYESEGEDGVGLKRRGGSGVSVESSSGEEDVEDGLKDEEEEARLKIYFCSRTHSQLSQFVKELKKTKFASELRVVSLGSRKNFCINEEVMSLGNSTQINERCLELQKSKKNGTSKTKIVGAGRRVRKTKASTGCPMLRSHKIQHEFRSEVSQQGPLDIEDLVDIGRTIGACPYYGSRSMVPAADLVILPYQSLLSKSSRESLGLSLKDNIVIIDEAHNLADSLISMYDSKITFSQLENVHSQLERYFQRFQKLLGPGNRRHIQTLIFVSRAFLRLAHDKDVDSVGSTFNTVENKSSLVSSKALNEFLFALNIDNINLVKLLRYIEESNIIHKVSGYGDKLAALQNNANGSIDEGSKLSAFRALVGMVSSLKHNDGDGRIIISRASSGQSDGYLKYVMLTGEKIFSEIVNQAHAVILAGGTLQPIEETKERLFPWIPPDRLHFFSCGHIVSSENILPITVSRGPSGKSFDFSYSARSSSSMIEELGLLLCNLVAVVPEGIVVFFSSFDYECKVHDAWKASGILGRIMKKKRIFREPRKNTEVEVVLEDYKEAIDSFSSCNATSCNGAVLFAVVGGKISEGINFSDGMGRCIVMVGLPYPSPSDIELIERVKYIEGLDGNFTDKRSISSVTTESSTGDIHSGFDILRCCKNRGKQYYENLCIKAVNQSIGRAIRHMNDYATILLVDARYSSDPSKRSSYHLTNKLPQWIKGSLVSRPVNYGEVHKMLHQFFKFHKNKESA